MIHAYRKYVAFHQVFIKDYLLTFEAQYSELSSQMKVDFMRFEHLSNPFPNCWIRASHHAH